MTIVSAVAATKINSNKRSSPCNGFQTESPKRPHNNLASLLLTEEKSQDLSSDVIPCKLHFVEDIADQLESVTCLNNIFFKLDAQDDVLRKFRAAALPAFPLRVYLSRLVSHLDRWKSEESETTASDLGVRSLVVALVYVDRIHRIHPKSRICSWNVHRLLLVGMLLCTKITEDRPISNDFWAKVGGVSLQELNSLEMKMCRLLGYRLHVSSDIYENCIEKINHSFFP